MPIISADSFENGDWLQIFEFGSSYACDDVLIIEFLNALSRQLLRNNNSKKFPDLITFAYYCRKSNITRILATLPDRQQRFGWGTSIHISPSNIPINFAFSWIMAMLAGNSSIVRLPSRTFPQTDLLVEAVDETLLETKFAPLKSSVAFVQTERNSLRLNSLVSRTQALLVWGGDSTVAEFRSRPKRPSCVELYFPDRVSSALVDASAYLALTETGRIDLAKAFFNDSYLVDQNACSSPSIVFWTGSKSEVLAAQELFWDSLSDRLTEDYSLDPVAKIDKMLNVMHVSDKLQRSINIDRSRADVWLSQDKAVREMPLRFGTFIEIHLPSVAELSQYLRENEQTLTVFGVAPNDVFETLKPNGCKVDRIVPIGRALDIGSHWDGKDTVSILSRHLQVG